MTKIKKLLGLVNDQLNLEPKPRAVFGLIKPVFNRKNKRIKRLLKKLKTK